MNSIYVLLVVCFTSVQGQPEGLIFQYEDELNLSGDRSQCRLSDQVNVKNLPSGQSAYTLEAQIKPTKANADSLAEGIMGWGPWGTRNSVNALRLGHDRQLVSYWRANDQLGSVDYSLNDGKYHHVATTYDGKVRKSYIDYKLVATKTPNPPAVQPGREFCVGTSNNRGEPFTGGIKSIRIWGKARTLAELKAGIAQPTSTTATTTTGTSTTNTVLQSMQDKLQKLQDLLASGDGSQDDVKKELAAVQEALQLLQDEVTTQRKDFDALAAKVDANYETLSKANSNLNVQSEQFAIDLRSVIAWQVMTPSPPPPPRGVCAGSACTVEVTGENDVLSLRAAGGAVRFESELCEETDLCDLARSVQDLLGKFTQA